MKQNGVTDNGLLTVEDARAILHIGRATLYRWMDSGKITSVRFYGRRLIPKSEVERLRSQPTE